MVIQSASGDKQALPKETFRPWVRWVNRLSQPDKDKSGVYLISRFEQKPPDGPANPCDQNVVYIGESSRDRFKGRWRSFHRAAFGVNGKHRGGKKYREQFGGDSSVLYVATLSSEVLLRVLLGFATCDWFNITSSNTKVGQNLAGIEELLIKYMERNLILLYSLEHGTRPICNAH